MCTPQVKYGGHGFAHILEHIVPKMKERGISEEDIKCTTLRGGWLSSEQLDLPTKEIGTHVVDEVYSNS